jgi:hypothetical protein
MPHIPVPVGELGKLSHEPFIAAAVGGAAGAATHVVEDAINEIGHLASEYIVTPAEKAAARVKGWAHSKLPNVFLQTGPKRAIEDGKSRREYKMRPYGKDKVVHPRDEFEAEGVGASRDQYMHEMNNTHGLTGFDPHVHPVSGGYFTEHPVPHYAHGIADDPEPASDADGATMDFGESR